VESVGCGSDAGIVLPSLIKLAGSVYLPNISECGHLSTPVWHPEDGILQMYNVEKEEV
jgi:hypothetical protein